MLISYLNFVNPLSMYNCERCLTSAVPFNQRAIAVNITTDKVNKRNKQTKKERKKERRKERKKKKERMNE